MIHLPWTHVLRKNCTKNFLEQKIISFIGLHICALIEAFSYLMLSLLQRVWETSPDLTRWEEIDVRHV
jgi:hypothetical protein